MCCLAGAAGGVSQHVSLPCTYATAVRHGGGVSRSTLYSFARSADVGHLSWPYFCCRAGGKGIICFGCERFGKEGALPVVVLSA